MLQSYVTLNIPLLGTPGSPGNECDLLTFQRFRGFHDESLKIHFQCVPMLNLTTTEGAISTVPGRYHCCLLKSAKYTTAMHNSHSHSCNYLISPETQLKIYNLTD